MKKLLLLTVSLLLTTSAFAQLEKGDQIVGGNIGLGFQLQNSGVEYNTAGSRVDWGSTGADIGGYYYYALTPHWAVGASASLGFFSGANINFGKNDTIDNYTHIYNNMLSARFTLNPSHRFRFYVPVGAGLTVSRQSLDIYYNKISYHNKHTDLSFGWFAGLGMEGEIAGSGWCIGTEMRLNGFSYNYGKLVENAPPQIRATERKRHLSYMSFHLTMSKRF